VVVVSSKNQNFLAAILTVFFLSGCQSIDLEQKPVREVQLSGMWTVDQNVSQDLENFTKAPSDRPGAKLSVREEIRRIGMGSGFAFVVQGFQVISANKMIIEQDNTSMGVNYDPGTYRDVTWGDRDRDIWRIRAGWQEADLVILSVAQNLRVLERYRLVQRNRMQVRIEVQADGVKRELTRFFDRKK
jgi:hypothetical protein